MFTIFTLRRRATSGAPRGRMRGIQRLALTLTGVAAAIVFLLVPAMASADTSTTLTVIGTSDVSDSGLIPTLIMPQFEQAYPQFTFKYIGTASGSAITSAETGSMDASALIVHAPTLENQFVADGYSYQSTGTGASTKPFGTAIWTNDFVLVGPLGDPAGVAANGATNAAQAFVDVATAGLAGKATFVSRGGTAGTTTEEHAIWADVSSAGLLPAGVTLCAVPATLGGGLTPVLPSAVATNGAPCPGNVLPSSTAKDLPSWYTVTGLTQGPNVIAANACTGATTTSGANSCYVFTDRGTYDYLTSGLDPAGKIANLKIVTRGPQASTAPGGAYALINYFHAYVLNPALVPNVNVTAAQDFVNFLTSPTVQNELQNYLPTATTGDPAGPPFVATANPTITIKPGIPANYNASKPLKLTGTVVNKELGFPALDGVPVTVDQVVNGLPVAVPGATGKTNAKGAFSLSFTPPVNGSYEVTTQAISKVEDATLTPPFGDLLSPSASAATKVKVKAAITTLKARSNGAGVAVFGTVAPGFGHVKGTVTISGRPVGSKKGYQKLATVKLAATDGNFAAATKLAAGTWQFKAVFADRGQVTTSPAKTITFTLGAKPTTSVSLQSVTLSGKTVKVSATVKPNPTVKGGSVKLLVLKATNPAKAQFNQKADASVKPGKTNVSLKAGLSGAGHYLLELKYSSPGGASSYTSIRGVTIKSTT